MYKNNTISTGKYNVLTFLPRNLQEQFSKMVNFYYLVMMIMELFKAISDSGGYPAVGMPLAFVIGVSMIKDIYEDFKRHVSDRRENNKKTTASITVTRNGSTMRSLKTIRWR